MILYKYMSSSTLKATLENYTVRLTAPLFFNDPFDCAMSNLDADPFTNIGLKNSVTLHAHRGQSGILCLTRNQYNLLMWAHYGSNHEGAVIGIDTEISGLDCELKNIIPAKSGSVIYSSVRPTSKGIELPRKVHSSTNKEILEKMFLYKSISWAYEEEVRVVRDLINENAEQTLSEYHHADIILPKDSIKEIYFGSRFSSFDSKIYPKEISSNHPDIHLKQCYLDSFNWEIKSRDIRDELKLGLSGINY